MWGQNGVTNIRKVLDQSPAFTNWGAASVPINFNPLNSVGYLRKLIVQIPYKSTAIQLAGTGDTVAAQAEKDFPLGRAIQSFSLVAQGISALYQLSKGGIDMEILMYMGSGRRSADKRSPTVLQSNAATNTDSLGHTSDQWQYRKGLTVGTQQGSGPYTQAVALALQYELPIIEYVQVPGSVLQGPQGSQPIQLPGGLVETGYLVAQNVAQNIRPQMVLNPLYVLTGGTYDSVLKATTAVPTGTISGQVNLFSEYYDVPTDPASQPPPTSFKWVVTRTTQDLPVAGNAVTVAHAYAGLLTRVAYGFFDSNDQIVDVSGQSTDGTISFYWGANVYKDQNIPFEVNLGQAAERYGEPPPAGFLFEDFYGDRSLTDVIDTANLPAVRTQISGLPGTVATCHVLEERLVPVRAG